MTATQGREALGRLVREVWVEWAEEQPVPKASWLTPWEQLDGGQREVDMRIGSTVAAVARAAERVAAARDRDLLAAAADIIRRAPSPLDTPEHGRWCGQAMTWLDRYEGKLP